MTSQITSPNTMSVQNAMTYSDQDQNGNNIFEDAEIGTIFKTETTHDFESLAGTDEKLDIKPFGSITVGAYASSVYNTELNFF